MIEIPGASSAARCAASASGSPANSWSMPSATSSTVPLVRRTSVLSARPATTLTASASSSAAIAALAAVTSDRSHASERRAIRRSSRRSPSPCSRPGWAAVERVATSASRQTQPDGRLRQDVAARRVIWTDLESSSAQCAQAPARPGYDLVAAQMGRSNHCRVPTVPDRIRASRAGRLDAPGSRYRFAWEAVAAEGVRSLPPPGERRSGQDDGHGRRRVPRRAREEPALTAPLLAAQ